MTSIKLSMDGINETISEFQRLSGESEESMSRIINDALYDTQEIAIRGIKGGPASGQQYTRGGKTVRRSAPGQYPMTDTGRLQSSIKVKPTAPAPKMAGRVGTNVQYGIFASVGLKQLKNIETNSLLGSVIAIDDHICHLPN